METSRLTADVPNLLAGHDAHGAHRLNTFKYLLQNVIHIDNKKMTDLGAGPCLFAKIAEDQGYEVTAVDGRTVRKPPDSELGSIKFIHADVRDFDLSGYSIVAIIGLFYHFDIQDQFSLLKRAKTAEKVVIETQVHFPEQVKEAALPWQKNVIKKLKLFIKLCLGKKTSSKRWLKPWQENIVKKDGYSGIIFPEGDSPQSSVGNKSSFWHTEESLLKMFNESGYEHVTLIDPIYCSPFGARRFYILE